MDLRDAPRLITSTPPGCITRKLRAFGPEIARLRRDGHTFEAIRTFLGEAGVRVSKSTVHREAARQQRTERWTRPPLNTARETPSADTARVLPAVSAPAPSVPRPAGIVQGSRDLALAFMKGHITNPLLKNRS